MKRWSLNFWNDWRYVNSEIVDVCLLRLNVVWFRSMFVGLDVMLLGFGFALTYYPNGDGSVPVESLGREHAP